MDPAILISKLIKDHYEKHKDFYHFANFSYIEAILSCHHQCLHNMQTEDKRRVKHFLQV